MVRYEVNAVIGSMVENFWRAPKMKTSTCFAEKGNSKEAGSRRQGAKQQLLKQKAKERQGGTEREAKRQHEAKWYIEA